ncbi:hypothetical protein [Halalkalibacter alkaliphilus]|uniref:Uncharacterized protein n=1 Tax=Halalkalibacter alkaliphilus TaxID=2917993 RepID=A0A9X1ZW89_9BACI|nr:hypothetical protein [Halalkalibacter alkaliphilus]MCL7745566.1 hypothetical protein [Halalkalibacter alkaliphilus]
MRLPTFIVFPGSDVDQEETFIVEASDEAEARSKNSPFAASEFPSEMYSYILEKTNFSYFDDIRVYPIELRDKQSL